MPNYPKKSKFLISNSVAGNQLKRSLDMEFHPIQ